MSKNLNLSFSDRTALCINNEKDKTQNVEYTRIQYNRNSVTKRRERYEKTLGGKNDDEDQEKFFGV